MGYYVRVLATSDFVNPFIKWDNASAGENSLVAPSAD
jgi:hypothetical protein